MVDITVISCSVSTFYQAPCKWQRVLCVSSGQCACSASWDSSVVWKYAGFCLSTDELRYHTFHLAAAWTWNSLPPDVMLSTSLPSFKRHLTTVLFARSFDCTWQFYVSSRDSRSFRLLVWCHCSLMTLCHHNHFVYDDDNDRDDDKDKKPLISILMRGAARAAVICLPCDAFTMPEFDMVAIWNSVLYKNGADSTSSMSSFNYVHVFFMRQTFWAQLTLTFHIGNVVFE